MISLIIYYTFIFLMLYTAWTLIDCFRGNSAVFNSLFGSKQQTSYKYLGILAFFVGAFGESLKEVLLVINPYILLILYGLILFSFIALPICVQKRMTVRLISIPLMIALGIFAFMGFFYVDSSDSLLWFVSLTLVFLAVMMIIISYKNMPFPRHLSIKK